MVHKDSVVRTAIQIEVRGTKHEPALPSVLSKNGRSNTHWRKVAEETKNLREVGLALIMEVLSEAGGFLDAYPRYAKATIHVHQFWCGRPMDVSGLAAASAPLVDAFMDAGVLQDDDPLTVPEFTFGFARVKHMAERRVTVRVEEVLE